MAATIRRDSAGSSLESYSRWRNRRNAMANVMSGVRASDLRTLGASVNHVIEHNTNERTVADDVHAVPDTSSNIGAENNYGLAAVLGFPVNATSSSSSCEETSDSEVQKEASSDSGDSWDSSEERERILGSPVHKRRRNALADALAIVDEDSLHRIQRLHAHATHHSHHERW